MISESPELVFIGTSLREQDQQLSETLASNCRKKVDVTIVGGVEKTKRRVETLLGSKVRKICTFNRFQEYAATL